jgi:nickel/cobalt transporter (NicO) family protein
MGRSTRSRAIRVLAAALAAGLVMVLPMTVLAHPLGNFTINHYAEVRVDVDRVLLDVVIDQAEIPTFQARQDFDLDADGSLSDEEIADGALAACDTIAGSITLAADDHPLEPRLVEAGLSFPLGVGGLATMRQVCFFEAALVEPIDPGGLELAFAEGSFPERSGWREIVVRGSGVAISAIEGEVRADGVSDRLRAYPEDQLASPLADTSVLVRATPGGPALPQLDIPDAEPVAAAAPPPGPSAAPSGAAPSAVPQPTPAVVPGGIAASELPDIFRQTDLTPVVLILSLAAAAALGAGHALTPGHGKTLMAAYLVGTRGSARHAIGLGAAVSVSHTVGILVLATIIVAATDLIAPDVVVRWAPVVAALSILLIGGWMLLGEVSRRRAARDGRSSQPDRDHAHPHAHDHGHVHPDAHGDEHGHAHPHRPTTGSTITWRSLFVLGLAGGLIPSTSALLILLGSIAAGRAAFGLVLVVAFGLGMAAVMSGIGLILVTARDRFDRVQAGAGLGRIRDAVPLVASVVVLGFGVVLTAQALSAVRVL